jgi:hypothetical protein
MTSNEPLAGEIDLGGKAIAAWAYCLGMLAAFTSSRLAATSSLKN